MRTAITAWLHQNLIASPEESARHDAADMDSKARTHPTVVTAFTRHRFNADTHHAKPRKAAPK